MNRFVPFSLAERYIKEKKLKSGRIWRLIFFVLILGFIATAVGILFLPWQQSISGRGRVIAFDSMERQQVVTARVSGNIAKWHVIEGNNVKQGDSLVDIEDNDPQRESRLEKQLAFLQETLAKAENALKEQKQVVKGQEEARKASIKAAEESRTAAEHAKEAQEKALVAAQTNLKRDEELYKAASIAEKDGIVPKVDYFRARAARDNSIAEIDRLKSLIEQADALIDERKAQVLRANADGLNQVSLATRAQNDVEQGIFNIQRQIEEAKTQLTRFKSRNVKAPCDGTIFRIDTNVAQGGAFVKEGDILAVIVPSSRNLVVELFIDGMDLPLIQKDAKTGEYPHVRLQFEGWPAVQFVGWPSAAVGTFGGKVILVDSHDDGTGKFRILVKPDPRNDKDAWPGPDQLRQGNQAIGWVFLHQVSIGWELWRRLNGFPPSIPNPGTGKSQASDKPK